jgi:hypothetical protein
MITRSPTSIAANAITERLDPADRLVTTFHTAVDIGDPHLDGGSSRLFAVGRYLWLAQRG